MSPRRPRLSVLFPVVLALALAAEAMAVSRPHVLLITLDTTRPDHLGAYGYARDTSPALDRLARDGLVYDRAFSTSSWTLPAHASLFTGLFPTTHGARYDAQGELVLGDAIVGSGVLGKVRASPLAGHLPVLAEILAEAGYATGGIVAGPWMKRVFGLGRGFAHYDDGGIDDVHGRLAADVSEQANAWISAQLAREVDVPFFLFLNYYDPHGPYTDPAGYARHFLPPNTVVFPPPKVRTKEFLSGVYDGEIRYMDEHLGRLFDHLRELGIYDDMWIIVTADHGELLGEHDKRGHGSSLYEEELRIPLIVKRPKSSGKGRSDAPVQLTDVLPLLLDALQIDVPAGVQGGAPPAIGHPVYAEVYPLLGAKPLLDWRVLVDGDLKTVWTSDAARRLFDIAADPGEQVDLAPAQPERAAQLARELDRFVAGLPAPERRTGDAPVREIDDETRRALEGLGYLE